MPYAVSHEPLLAVLLRNHHQCFGGSLLLVTPFQGGLVHVNTLQPGCVNTYCYLWTVSHSFLWIPGSKCKTNDSCHIIIQHVCSPQSSSGFHLTSAVVETNSFPGKWVNRSIFAQSGSVQHLQLLNLLRRRLKFYKLTLIPVTGDILQSCTPTVEAVP